MKVKIPKVKSKRNKILFRVLLCLLLIGGCSWLHKKSKYDIPDYRVSEDISVASQKLDDSSKKIEESAKKIEIDATEIKEETNKIDDKISIEMKKEVVPHLDVIEDKSNCIINETRKLINVRIDLDFIDGILKSINEKMEAINNDLKTFKNERDEALEKKEIAEKNLEKANEEMKSATRRTMQWLILVCVIGFGISIALIILKMVKIGIASAGASIATLILAVTVGQHLVLIAWVGLAIIVAIASFLIYQVIIQKRANKELIETAELAKMNLSPEAREKLFDKENGLVNDLQKNSTKNIVKNEKSKISKLWNYAKNEQIKVENEDTNEEKKSETIE